MKTILIIIVILFLLYLLAIRPGTGKKEEITELKRQKLYAHRGLYDNASDHPENSMPAFANAIKHGFGIEMDVQLTSDGIPVVFHDFSLGRVARDSEGNPVRGKVKDYTFEQLQQFHLLNSTEKIPLFSEFLKLVDGKVPLIVELKIENSDTRLEVCPKADDLLQNYRGLYCIESFHPRGVLWYRKNRPEVIRGQLSSMFNKTNADRKKWWLIYFLTENLMFNFLTRPDFIAYDVRFWRNLSRNMCRYLYHNTAVAWTVKTKENLQERAGDYDMFIFEGFIPSREDA